MKSLRILALIPVVLLLCGRASAQGVPTHPLVTVDEFGIGTVQTAQGTQGMVCLLNQPDVIAPIAPLVYTLPFNGTQGLVELLDGAPQPDTQRPISDFLYFDGQGKLEFFSNPADEIPVPPADLAVPVIPVGTVNTIEPNIKTLDEIGSETDNGAVYTPVLGEPGYDPSRPTYHFISDGHTSVVPEPSSFALLVSGMLTGLPLARRRLRRG